MNYDEDDGSLSLLRTEFINRIVLEFENGADRFQGREEVRRIILLNWKKPIDQWAAIPTSYLNVDTCRALLGPNGYAIWQVMKLRVNNEQG